MENVLDVEDNVAEDLGGPDEGREAVDGRVAMVLDSAKFLRVEQFFRERTRFDEVFRQVFLASERC